MVYVYESEWRQLVLYHRVLYIQRPRGTLDLSGTSGMLRLFGKICHNGFAASGDWKNTDLAIATGCTSLPQRYNTDEWSPYGPNCIDHACSMMTMTISG